MKSFEMQRTSGLESKLGRIREWYTEEARPGCDLLQDTDEVIFSLEAEADTAASDNNGIFIQVAGGIGDIIGYASGVHFVLTGKGFDDFAGGTGIDIVLGGEGEDVLRGGAVADNDNAVFERMEA